MKKIAFLPIALAGMFIALPAKADGMFTGDVKTACEVILCLSSGSRPSECTSPIQHYFSIKRRQFSDTLKARRNFLNLCPVAHHDAQTRSLVNDIVNGAGRCDAASINSTNTRWTYQDDYSEGYLIRKRVRVISNQRPSYCAEYEDHSYTDLDEIAPRYVGTPERGGYWVDARNYESELRKYNERIAREDEQRRQQTRSPWRQYR